MKFSSKNDYLNNLVTQDLCLREKRKYREFQQMLVLNKIISSADIKKKNPEKRRNSC